MSNEALAQINPLAILKPTKPLRRYTLAEYLRREEQAEALHEYYNGFIIKRPMVGLPHNIICANVTAAVCNEIEVNGLDEQFTVMVSQQLVYLPELNLGLYPDALVVAEKPEHFDDNEVLLLNPILIVEVASRSTRKYDRTVKFDEYKTAASLREYVLIDQKQCRIESRFREEPNLWRETVETDIQKSIFLKSIGCSIDLARVYKKIVF